ncbi:MAG: peptide chain release factor N(5)-glutamine methyltransferase, partial [Ghiorsea sp.]|nr:peptide chain release factor N(5)-glutamine methyltransferase [Ghiorsea sp.]
MNTRSLLQQAMQQLQQVGVDAPRKDAALLLMVAWDISQTSLMVKMMDEVPEYVVAAFQPLLQRRLKREPIAYILGKKAFWKDEFMVTPDVLVPRPETEHLIEMVLKYQPNQHAEYKMADIGTGSGCIAVSLAKEYPYSAIAACDISNKALAVAKLNAKQLGASQRMTFYEGDLYQALPQGETYDVIVSNPPYVSQDEMDDLEAELSF